MKTPLRHPSDVWAQCRYIVEQFEGGISDHPDDRGGLTRYGVTIPLFAEFLRLPPDDPSTLAQFYTLTREDAIGVMVEMFAMRPNIHAIQDARLRFAVLDYAIHSGPGTAIKALQRALGVREDGILGRITEGAVSRHADPEWVRERVMDARYQLLGRLVVRDRRQIAFLLGWLIRLGRVTAWRAALVLLALLLGACAARPLAREPLVPSPDRLHALAAVETPAVRPGPTDLEIHVYPRFVFAGSGVRITCLVPSDPAYRWLTYGIALLRTSGAALGDQTAALTYETLIYPVPCGTWIALCEVVTASTAVITRTYALDSFGTCNSIKEHP